MIRLYVTRNCPYCARAKSLLEAKGIPFENVSLDDRHELRMQLSQQHDWRTVPMIFIDDVFIGGYDELQALNKAGKLETAT